MKFGRTVDADENKLWESIVAGDVKAFTTIVERHQASVSAIAYGIVGDFAASQDIAQETFFAAWNSRDQLRDPTRAAAWLCGISRNLAKNWQRKNYRNGRHEKTVLTFDPATDADDPSRVAIAEEEQQLVWATLSEMPENYREAMMLYYRQGESISDVAMALEISEEAARQRLSRGRSMLRTRVSLLVEDVLKKTSPGRSFTAKVMSGLVGLSIVSKTSSAAVAGNTIAAGLVAGKTLSGAATASATTGGSKAIAATAASGFGGAVIGVFGAAIGTAAGAFLPAEFAPTETERQFLWKRGVNSILRSLVVGVAILALTGIWTYFKFSVLFYLCGLAPILAIYIPIEFWYLRQSNKVLVELREKQLKEMDPNLSTLKNKVESNRLLKYLTGWRGRRYRSPISILGLPLIDIQVNDPEFDTGFRKNYTAKGWIAIGDHAYGVLAAIGSMAVGAFAFGGRSIGIVALGGLSIGVFSLGGLSLGFIALGGGAVGWDACGGAAAGWNSAVGERAYAYHVASGTHAVARDFAVGRFATASEANTDSAKAVADAESLQRMLDYFLANQVFCYVVMGSIVFGLTAIFLGFALTRKSEELAQEQTSPPLV